MDLDKPKQSCKWLTGWSLTQVDFKSYSKAINNEETLHGMYGGSYLKGTRTDVTLYFTPPGFHLIFI